MISELILLIKEKKNILNLEDRNNSYKKSDFKFKIFNTPILGKSNNNIINLP